MSRISLTAGALLVAGLAFGLGRLSGRPGEPPRGAPARAQSAAAEPDAAGVAAAVQAALTRPDPLRRAAALAQLLESLGPEASGAVDTAYGRVVLDAGDIEHVLLAEWRASLDPEAAFEWARREGARKNPAVMASVIRAWARRDPERARRAVERLARPELRSEGVGALITGWEQSGRRGLLEFIGNLPSGADRQLAVANLTHRRVFRNGVEDTIRWAEELPGEPADFKLDVFRRVASAVAEVDPKRAAAWAEKHVGGEYGSGLFRRVGVRWAKRDGAATLAWLSTLPAGRERDAGVQESYRVWLARDRERAMAWMREARPEPWLEPALVLFALSVATDSCEEALGWVAHVRDEDRRREAIVKIGRRWHAADPEAAQAWLDRSGLPDETRAWILRPIPKPRGRRAAPAWDG